MHTGLKLENLFSIQIIQAVDVNMSYNICDNTKYFNFMKSSEVYFHKVFTQP